jgi:hypothetical protein
MKKMALSVGVIMSVGLAGVVMQGHAARAGDVTPAALGVSPAPVSFDGNVAGRPTDLVFVLVKPPFDPEVAGFGMQAGDTLRIELPAAFQRNPGTPIREDSDVNLVATKGWPQAAIKQTGQYRVVYDARGNSIAIRADKEIATQGRNTPGIKVLHLRGDTFTNPTPGRYPVGVRLLGPRGETKRVWRDDVEILPTAPAARLAPSNYHLPPGTNSDFQQAAPNTEAPHALGLLLWGEAGTPLNGVGIAPRDPARYPRYTGGLLVQDSDNNGRLDPAVDRVVGGIIGSAPSGAKGQSATSPATSDGGLALSGAVPVHPKFPAAAGAGKPKPGLMTIRFRAGDKPGLYRPTVELTGGNRYQFTIRAE